MNPYMCYNHSQAAQCGDIVNGNHNPGNALLQEMGQSFTNCPLCNCSWADVPQERTILHGILTGRGHEFGYGSSDRHGHLSGLHSRVSAHQFSTKQIYSQEMSVHSNISYQHSSK